LAQVEQHHLETTALKVAVHLLVDLFQLRAAVMVLDRLVRLAEMADRVVVQIIITHQDQALLVKVLLAVRITTTDQAH
jgi:hypothetical protein